MRRPLEQSVQLQPRLGLGRVQLGDHLDPATELHRVAGDGEIGIGGNRQPFDGRGEFDAHALHRADLLGRLVSRKEAAD